MSRLNALGANYKVPQVVKTTNNTTTVAFESEEKNKSSLTNNQKGLIALSLTGLAGVGIYLLSKGKKTKADKALQKEITECVEQMCKKEKAQEASVISWFRVDKLNNHKNQHAKNVIDMESSIKATNNKIANHSKIQKEYDAMNWDIKPMTRQEYETIKKQEWDAMSTVDKYNI